MKTLYNKCDKNTILYYKGGFILKTIWGIEGSSYDGCNGWNNWRRDELFETKEKAIQYIKDNLSYSSYTRYSPVEIKIN